MQRHKPGFPCAGKLQGPQANNVDVNNAGFTFFKKKLAFANVLFNFFLFCFEENATEDL